MSFAMFVTVTRRHGRFWAPLPQHLILGSEGSMLRRW